MPNRQPDFLANLILLPTAEGGRNTPISSGYRTNLDMGVPGMHNIGKVDIGDNSSIMPGESGLVRIHLLLPQLQEGRLYLGFEFKLCEGFRVVGNGKILEVFNSALLKEG